MNLLEPGEDRIRFSEAYRRATVLANGRCPIETGVLGKLADNECKHGRLSGDSTPPCGCWPGEGAAVIDLPRRPDVDEDVVREASA